MKRQELEKKKKIQLWIMMCEMNLVGNDCSEYRMKWFTKQDMIDMILAEVEK